MTVQQLIDKLKQFNPNTKICISDGWEGQWYPADINMVLFKKDILVIDVDVADGE